MTDRRIYTATVPSGAFDNRRGTTDASRQVAKLATLSGSSQVSTHGPNPDELPIDGQFRGRYSETAGRELQELLGAPDIEYVPFYAVGEPTPVDGYYMPESSGGGRVQPQHGGAVEFSGRLVLEGTQKQQWIAVETQLSQPDPGHTFGNETTGYVGLPSAATRVEVVDATSEPTSRVQPTPDTTLQAEHGAVDLYDAKALSIDNPVLLYELDYPKHGDVDAALFDTYDRASETNADGAFVWGQVFSPGHEFRGDAVLENGILRLTITEPAGADGTGSLTAERWDDANSAWSSVSLPATDWAPLDLDVVSIEQAVVTAQLEFEATADTTDASAGDVYALDVHLLRGYDDAQFWIPQSVSDPIPTDLEEHLDPIADESVVEPGTEQTLVARSEVRK